MKLYRHWVAETREIAGTTFHLRDGSNVSPEDAAAKLERRAAILRDSEGRNLSAKESAAVREALLDLGGRTPEGEYEAAICEEILDEAPRCSTARTRASSTWTACKKPGRSERGWCVSPPPPQSSLPRV